MPPVEALFLEYAEEEGFIEELIEETNDFAESIGGQDTSNRARIGANASIDDILGEILQAVQTLKVIIAESAQKQPRQARAMALRQPHRTPAAEEGN